MMTEHSDEIYRFYGVLPLLALSKTKLQSEEVKGTEFVPHSANAAEITATEEVEVAREDPPPSLALSQAETQLQKVTERKTSLQKELDRVNMQLVEVMTKNDELKADISKAQEKSADVTLGQLQHIQGQKLRANELIKEIEKFRCTELKALEQEVNDLSAAQRKTSNDLTLETRELQALLQCLRGKERQVYGELWRLEDEATVLEGKIQCWKLFEEISLNAGEESRQRHQQALSVLDAMVQDFTKVNRKAEEVCLSLASQCLL